ncbi:MAG: OsmC family protein [Bacteroidales bacterium]|jgi:putative redox protein|nr:OsmC family protein [Bacteroidales bacterium]
MGKTDIVTAEWQDNMVFETTVDGHKVIIDSDPSFGGQNKGPKPKPFMLAALAGCTAMDVISMLRKMRVVPERFLVKVDGSLTEEHPKHYNKIHVTYEFTGDDLPMSKLKRAVELSENSYCGVMHVYRKALELTSEIVIKPKT